jgi:hypothetical protein
MAILMKVVMKTEMHMFRDQHSLFVNWLGYTHYLKERPFCHIHPWQQS